MKLSEISINRPVLAAVMTLVLVLFGTISFLYLPVREYPDIEVPIVSVRVVYPGASARIVEADVTVVLEETLSGIESLKTITSSSREEVSRVTLEFDLKRNLDDATNDVRDRVFGIRRWLPAGIEEPVISKASGDEQAVVWLSLNSNRLTELEVTDFAERYIKDRLTTLPEVSTVWIWGARRYAMRIWLDADRLASRRLTVQDVEQALHNQNVAIPSGRIESDRREFSVRTRGELHTPEQFNRVILAYRQGYPVRLDDVGYAELGAEDDRKLVRRNGQPTISIGVVKQSKGNTLAVARAVKEKLHEIQSSLPDGMTLSLVGDGSLPIERSLHEVYVAMGISVTLVVLVIFLFIGNVSATLIPAIAIPASIVSAFTLMHALGCSINVLTLLGLVLAIGLVVDDAIVMLENIHRRIERGQPPIRAAIEGSREVGFAVVATTLSLVAVFVPIVFLKGTISRLFAELALAIAGPVLLSGFIALTLTPMMSARMMTSDNRAASGHRQLPRVARPVLAGMLSLYRRILSRALQAKAAVFIVGITSVVGGLLLFSALPSELAPLEDKGAFLVTMRAPEGSTIRYTDHYARQIERLVGQIPEVESYLTWVAGGLPPALVTTGGSQVALKDWSDRKRTPQGIAGDLNLKLAQIPGVTASAYSPSQFGTALPVQFVIGGRTYEEVERSVNLMLERTKTHPALSNPEADLGLNKPEVDIRIDRNKAADLGISVATIGQTLQILLGGRPVTFFDRDGKEYPVIVKIRDKDRVKPTDIHAFYVRGRDDELIQLSNLVTIEETVVPRELQHYDKMRAAILSAGVGSGYSLGDALDYLEQTAQEVLPTGTPIRYAGESKQFKEASASLYLTFAVAILVIYLVLAAEFESFLHPFTILLSVPPAITGALLTLILLGGTLNIYSQIGMIMLIGLVTKNAILIVDFANRLRAQGTELLAAVIEAAALRLRPILMTTLATILGAIPLALATGAGSAARRQIGWVVIGGMVFSTVLTLFLAPAIYVAFARGRAGKVKARSDECERVPQPAPISAGS